MSENETLIEPLRIDTVGHKLTVDVPWRQAEGLHTFLDQHGIGSTICLDPRTREARLEVWPGATLARLQEALGQWKG